MPLSPAVVSAVAERLSRANASPGSPPPRPLHVVYGGAHLFNRGTIEKLGARARESMAAHGDDDDVFAAAVGAANPEVARRTRRKLETSPVDALCIDFEDGYGPRQDAEEDADATRAATELGATAAGPVIGFRIKSLGRATFERAVRTLTRFLDAAPSRPGLTVTLPKVTSPEEVHALVTLLDALGRTDVAIELMIETAFAVQNARALVAAGDGRVIAVHLGASDLTAELGVGARDQSLSHPYNELARMLLKLTLPDVGISDGTTTTLPTGTDSGAIRRAWSLHATNVRNAIRLGIWQGWDLHPAQLPARWGAVFASFLEERAPLAARLAAFVAKATQASLVGQDFDDAATAQGLVTFFRRGLACGALEESDLAPTTLTRADLDRPFAEDREDAMKRALLLALLLACGGTNQSATPAGDGEVEERVVYEKMPDGSVRKTTIRTTKRTVPKPPPAARPADPYPADPLVRYNVERVNAYRARKSLPPLLYDRALSEFAMRGSQQLAKDHRPHAHFAAHAQGAPGFGSRAAENQGDENGVPVLDPNPTKNGQRQVDIMMELMFNEGPGGGHYDNMMSKELRRIGVGLYNSGGRLYVTNDFSD